MMDEERRVPKGQVLVVLVLLLATALWVHACSVMIEAVRADNVGHGPVIPVDLSRAGW